MKDFGLKELLTLPPKIMMALFFSTGLVLFLPEDIIEKVYLNEFKDKYGSILGIVFIVSLSILLFSLIFFIFQYFFMKFSNKKFMKNAEDKLLSLNRQERYVIREFFNTSDNTLNLPVNNGLTTKLEYYKIIGKAASTSIVSGYDSNDWRFPYLLQPWVYEVIKKHPNYFNGI